MVIETVTVCLDSFVEKHEYKNIVRWLEL